METLNTVPQSLLRRQPGAELRYLLSSERGAFIERLRAHLERASGSERRLAPLSDFLTIKRGEELGRKSALLVRDQPPSALAGQPHAAAPPAGQAQMFPAPAASADPPPASAGQAQMFPAPAAPAGQAQMFPDPAASAGQAQMFPGPPPAGHPQGVALLYTPPSHPPHHRSLAQRANGIVYSRATPCGWPAGGVSADAGGGSADAGGGSAGAGRVSAAAGGGAADAGGGSADAGGGPADAGDGSADAGGGSAGAGGVSAGGGGGPGGGGGGSGGAGGG